MQNTPTDSKTKSEGITAKILEHLPSKRAGINEHTPSVNGFIKNYLLTEQYACFQLTMWWT